MMINRRTFMGSLAAAGALATVPAVALPPDAIQETVREYKELRAYWHANSVADQYGYRRGNMEVSAEVTRRFDELLGCTLERFGSAVTTNKEAGRKCLRTQYQQATLESDLRSLPEAFVPIAIAKLALGVDKMPIIAPKMANWRGFCKIYSASFAGV